MKIQMITRWEASLLSSYFLGKQFSESDSDSCTHILIVYAGYMWLILLFTFPIDFGCVYFILFVYVQGKSFYPHVHWLDASYKKVKINSETLGYESRGKKMSFISSFLTISFKNSNTTFENHQKETTLYVFT